MAGLPTVSTTPAEVASQLQARGVSSDDAHTAATAWGAAQAGVSTINAVVGIAHGRADAASLSPLLAVGVTAATANPLAGAIVAGAIPIAGGILSELFGSPSNACSGWFVGSWCFPGPRPTGPHDAAWQTFASFDDANGDPANARPNGRDAQGRLVGGYPLTVRSRVGAAFPYYFAILCDEQWFAQKNDGDVAAYFQIDPANVPALRDFYRAFYALWRANAEQAINAFPTADPHMLLAALKDAWNRSHDGSRTVSLTPKGGESDALCYGGTYLELLLGGANGLDGLPISQRDDLTFHAGPVMVDPTVLLNNVHLLLGPNGYGLPAPTHTAAKTVATVAAVPAAATLAAFLYAYMTGQAFDAVVKHAWRWATGKGKR